MTISYAINFNNDSYKEVVVVKFILLYGMINVMLDKNEHLNKLVH